MVHSIVKNAKQNLPKNSSADLIAFLEAFFEKVPDEDIKILSPAEIAETVQTHWKMLKSKKAKRPEISISFQKSTEDEDGPGNTIIDLIHEDMPFLVDSVSAEITQHYKLISLLLHPILPTGKNKQHPEQSHMHIKLQGVIPDSMAKQLSDDLCEVIQDVYDATKDWGAMRDRLRDCQKALNLAPAKDYNDDEIEEYLYFLEYMYKDNFTLLGYREYKFTEKNGKVSSDIVKNKSLGLLSDERKAVYINEGENGLPQDLQRLRHDLPPLTVSKVNKRSTVHRSVPLDAIAVKQFDEKGRTVGECLFIGLFTSVTYSRSIQDIPYLRRKTETVMRRSGFTQGSHDFKALRHILEKYPRDELFQIDIDRLLKFGLSILRLQERQRIALYTRPDSFGRYISCLVYVPRDRYDTRIRKLFQIILEKELNGHCSNFYTNLDDSPLARVMYIIDINKNKDTGYDGHKIEHLLQKAGQLWTEKLSDVLKQESDENLNEKQIIQHYGNAFPSSYQEEYTPGQALHDIAKIEETIESGQFGLDLYKCKTCAGSELSLKVFKTGKPIILSDILPVLENMGLRVLAEKPFEVKPQHSDKHIWIHDFLMETSDEYNAADIDKVKEQFEDALSRIWYGEAEDDPINHLILKTGMSWRSIMILRTYVRYTRQMRFNYSTRLVEFALVHHPAIAKHLVNLFDIYFNPDIKKKRDVEAAGIMVAIDHELSKVVSFDEDRILRTLISIMQATLRTNFFQRNPDGSLKPYLSVKLDSNKIKELPKPRPYREIFVYSPRMEGIHLRGDVIARGGLRWSDRLSDFRTEILDLMKAQQVKNSVIVPMGAKGGFVVKKPPKTGGKEAFIKEGIECYKTLIRGLLDITDNRDGLNVIPPENVVRRDDDDPYLVVAADKGTATFSDIANGLSQEYGFWLDDAFASGGSAGYDHKAMGITARGAWESVKRLFREMDHDTQTQEFDVIGVGDMSGDVFGNGMLLSEKIRLVGAFNHLRIFCDPNPDVQSSYKERKRLFDAVKGWDTYDESKLSKGGRIFLRSEKSLKLTAEIRKRFNIDRERVTPNELIQAMLKTETDLLWFGGIGTYIKATYESHADVGDKANDMIRINAPDVQAKVIGEGANLGMTQPARIEFSKLGGRVNADFIDNAGGVDSSDHEVNIKILLGSVMKNKNHQMNLKSRNKLLERMTNDIATHVLRNNYRQVQGISLIEKLANENLALHASFIQDLEREEGLDRVIERLPDDDEIENRLVAGKGLTRPELGIVQAYAKIHLTRKLLECDIPDTAIIREDRLLAYFPEALTKKYKKEILSHQLSREIVATSLANSVVNRLGPTFVKVIMDKTGASCDDVMRAWLIVREAFNLKEFWKKVEALDNKVPAHVQLKAMREMNNLAERETIWFLSRLGRIPNIKRDIDSFKEGIGSLRNILDTTVTPNLASLVKQRTQLGINDGLPKELAQEIALIPTLAAACDIIRISQDRRMDISLTAKTYFELGEYFHFDWLRQQALFIAPDNHWDSDALDSLIEQLYTSQASLTVKILKDMQKDEPEKTKKKNNPDLSKSILDEWIKGHEKQAHQLDSLFDSIKNSSKIDISMMVIAEQRLRQLCGL